MKPNGIVLWEGASRIDGAPSVCILTGLASRSSNRKTGSMLQTWILRANLSPTDAIRSGSDTSVCGTCPHRSKASGGAGTCYVNVGQAPLAVWRAWTRGRYPVASEFGARLAIARSGRMLRIGSYGDPGALPVGFWAPLVQAARGNITGYSHRWKEAPDLRGVCMASVDTIAELFQARALGFATFRVAPRGDALRIAGEARCPASSEAGKRVTCDTCPIACNGSVSRGILGRVIQAHGASANRV
jgi:hypothetical protein